MKNLLLFGLLILLSYSSSGQMRMLLQNADTVQYISSTAIITDSDSDIDLPFPAETTIGDVAIIVFSQKGEETFQSLTAQGFTALSTFRYDANFSYAVWYRRIDGTEPATIDVGISDVTGNVGGIMHIYRNVRTLTNPQAPTTSAVLQVVSQGATITANKRDLGVEVWAIGGNLTATGGGTNWTEDSNVTTASNSGFTFVAASFYFTSTGVSNSISYPGVNSYSGYARFYLQGK